MAISGRRALTIVPDLDKNAQSFLRGLLSPTLGHELPLVQFESAFLFRGEAKLAKIFLIAAFEGYIYLQGSGAVSESTLSAA